MFNSYKHFYPPFGAPHSYLVGGSNEPNQPPINCSNQEEIGELQVRVESISF